MAQVRTRPTSLWKVPNGSPSHGWRRHAAMLRPAKAMLSNARLAWWILTTCAVRARAFSHAPSRGGPVSDMACAFKQSQVPVAEDIGPGDNGAHLPRFSMYQLHKTWNRHNLHKPRVLWLEIVSQLPSPCSCLSSPTHADVRVLSNRLRSVPREKISQRLRDATRHGRLPATIASLSAEDFDFPAHSEVCQAAKKMPDLVVASSDDTRAPSSHSGDSGQRASRVPASFWRLAERAESWHYESLEQAGALMDERDSVMQHNCELQKAIMLAQMRADESACAVQNLEKKLESTINDVEAVSTDAALLRADAEKTAEDLKKKDKRLAQLERKCNELTKQLLSSCSSLPDRATKSRVSPEDPKAASRWQKIKDLKALVVEKEQMLADVLHEKSTLEEKYMELEGALCLARKREGSMRSRLQHENSTNLNRQIAKLQMELDNNKLQLKEANATLASYMMEAQHAEEHLLAAAEMAEHKRRMDKVRLVERQRSLAKTATLRKLTVQVRALEKKICLLTTVHQRELNKRDEGFDELAGRHSELCCRVKEFRASASAQWAQMQEAKALMALQAAEAADKAKLIEKELAGSQQALQAFRAFDAQEGGRCKDVVRTAYYKLLNRKVPSNQIEGIVRDVLEMVGVEVKRLPKRSLAARMRLEMNHLADVAAGVGLAIAENVVGASDDTTKLQVCYAHATLPT